MFLKGVGWFLSGKRRDLSDLPNVLYFQCASTVKIWVTILQQISTALDFGSFKITDQYLEVSVLSCAHKDELLAFGEIRGSVKQIPTYASN